MVSKQLEQLKICVAPFNEDPYPVYFSTFFLLFCNYYLQTEKVVNTCSNKFYYVKFVRYKFPFTDYKHFVSYCNGVQFAILW
jgi:hypothetical protein